MRGGHWHGIRTFIPEPANPATDEESDMVLTDMAEALRHQPTPNAALLRQAMLAPELLYATPSDVLLDHTLPSEQKLALLRNWQADLEQRSVAREEGMTDSEEGLSHAIAAVSRAIDRLQAR